MTSEPAMSAAWWQRSSVLPIVLLASLGANLFLAGWLLGGHPMRPPPPPMDHFDDQIHEALSADGAKIMQTAFDTIHRRFEAHAAEAKAARARQMVALKAVPFNPDDYIAASQSARAVRDSDRAQADQEIARAIALLSPEDRNQLVRIRQRGHHGSRGNHF